MEKLTEKEAISECKKLWTEIEKSGLTKYEFLETPEGQVWIDKDYESHCPLCECSEDCYSCPLVVQYNKMCPELGFNEDIHSTPEWFKAIRELK